MNDTEQSTETTFSVGGEGSAATENEPEEQSAQTSATTDEPRPVVHNKSDPGYDFKQVY